MAKRENIWAGEHYKRYDMGDKAGYNWRNRRTGDIIASEGVKVDKTTGKVLIFDGKHFKGVEKTLQHVYSQDPKKSASSKKKYETRVKANRLGAIKKRKSHKRKLRKTVG